MKISLRLLRYVVAAADHCNVTEAARQLKVSQPSVSAAIAELESILGIAIFMRHHAKGVTLTPAGQRLVQEARALLRHAEDFTRTAESLGDAIRGEITVACCKGLASRYMPALMMDFTRAFPDINVQLQEGDQEEILSGLAEGRAEVGVSYDFMMPPSLHIDYLMELAPKVTLPADHKLAGRTKVSLKDLAPEPFILCDLPHFRDYFLNLFAQEGLTPNIVFGCKSMELIRGLVARGQGYSLHTIVPETSVTYDGGRLVVRSLAEKFRPARVGVLTPKSQSVRPAVSVFVEFMKESFAVPAEVPELETASG
jgi:DNA-binding transcriptional LysR family regulator